MNGTVVSIAVFLALLLAGLALDVRARAGGGAGEAVTLGQALAALMRTTPGRVAVLACWVWAGVHFLAR